MGGGRQGERKHDKYDAVRVVGKGANLVLTSFSRGAGGAEGGAGAERSVAVERSEQDLRAFHRQLVQAVAARQAVPREEVLKELPFPAARGLPLRQQLAAGGAVAASLALLLADPLLGLVALCAALGSFAAARLRARVQPAAVEQFLNLCLTLDGGEAELSALLEAPQRPDWPARVGAIDLTRHDLPHASSQTEWWYFNTHLQQTGGPSGSGSGSSEQPRALSAFVCFFRILKHVDASGRRYYSHALTWSVSDVANKRCYSDVVLENDAPSTMLKTLERDVKDPILQRALREILERGNVPRPDRLFVRNPAVPRDRLELDYEAAQLHKDAAGRYVLRAVHPELPCELRLVFSAQKQPVRHGDDGVVKGRDGDDMFYYCISRMAVTGSVRLPKPHLRGGSARAVDSDAFAVAGLGWYDHEFGGKPEAQWDYTSGPGEASSGEDASGKEASGKLAQRYAWNWAACQLEDGSEVTAAMLVNPDSGAVMEVKAIVVEPNGERRQFDGKEHGVRFEPHAEDAAPWTSVRTFVDYPTRYMLSVPGQLQLTLEAAFPDQECMTLICKPAFWEGRCEVRGTRNGRAVRGLAYVERNGFGKAQNIKTFFKAVGEQVRRSVQKMYPLRPTYEEGLELIATRETEHYMKGVPLDVIGDTLIAPVRLIADRGGKSWRSYGALACVDCVGGDSRDFVDWLAMPEFLHVGSLIVDDIQDVSETRRGGPAAHKVYGEPLCINAGTAAYFQCEQMLKVPGLSAEELNKCYALYFSALRGGHAGQALDIHGLDYLMDSVVESGDAQLMEERLLAIHNLKTAVPAGTLARMGALVGKGSKEQVEAMGMYFEGIGIAFQIMDDVLNLRGIYSNESDKAKVGTELKTLGEDITAGKATMPVAKAMAMLKHAEQRRKLWAAIQAKPADQKTVRAIIADLEELGAVDACVQHAEALVNDAWAKLDKVIPDSFAKMMLRSFGWYVIERA